MCTQPIKILNPSRRLAHNRGQQLWLYVPCGHCADCRQKKQNEWRVRSYYECVDTFSDGYVLFDTLTYSPRYLPHLSDFMDVNKELDFSCFNSLDITLFIKRLRTNLFRLGYDVKDNLRYFIASEYGSIQYTTRPHYHCLFFVRNNFVPVNVLSSCIASSWSVGNGFHFNSKEYSHNPIGRTDGLPYRSSSYVNFHNTFRSLDQSQKKVVMYVAKYVAKDFSFDKIVHKRLYELMRWRYPDFDFSQLYDRKLYADRAAFYHMLCSYVMPFHRQSEHFGDFYIKCLGRDNIINDGYLKFNFDGVPVTFSLFASLKRKLFYNRSKIDGQYQWYLNNSGIEFKVRHFDRLVASLRSEIESYNLNHADKLSFDVVDCLFNHNYLQSEKVSSKLDYQKQLCLSSSCDSYNSLRNYCSIDRAFIHKSVLTKKDYGSKSRGFLLANKIYPKHCVKDLDSNSFITLDDFSKYSLFFPDIERQYEKLLSWKRELGLEKLVVARHKERLKTLYKNLNLC